MSEFFFLYDAKEAVAGWVQKRIGRPEPFQNFEAIGIGYEGRPIAGAVFHDYYRKEHGSMIEVSFAADSPIWATRGNLGRLFHYPFNMLGCTRITETISAKNHRSIKFNLGIGFRKEGEIRRGYDGKTNLIVLGMLKEECRWLQYVPKELLRIAEEKERRYG